MVRQPLNDGSAESGGNGASGHELSFAKRFQFKNNDQAYEINVKLLCFKASEMLTIDLNLYEDKCTFGELVNLSHYNLYP